MLENSTYNEEPVCYCDKCKSLNIRYLDNMVSSYCDTCGSTEIRSANIKDWQEVYKAKYGKYFINKANGRK